MINQGDTVTTMGDSQAKWVYSFGGGRADGTAAMRNLLGGKGANLAEMCNLGLPVPPGFTITTEVCTAYYACGRAFPDGLAAAIDTAIPAATAAIESEDFEAAMTALATLRAPVDAFFDHVMVNAPEAKVRANRLRLLNRIREATLAVADFSKVGG